MSFPHFLIQVRALDPDDDINAIMEYTIQSKDSSGIKDIFGLKKHSGELYLMKNMADYGELTFPLNFQVFCVTTFSWSLSWVE